MNVIVNSTSVYNKSSAKNLLRLKIILFFAYFTALQPWFFYSIIKSYMYVSLSVVFLMLLYALDKNFLFPKMTNKKFNLFVLFSIALLVYSISVGFNTFISYIPTILFVYFLLRLNSTVQIDVINFITKYLAIFLLLSLILHIVVVAFTISAPIFYPANGSYGYGFYQYYLDIIATHTPYQRFQSVFMEPGHLTMGLFPLLFINRFNLKNKYVLILFICQLCTLSLSGYICCFIAFLMLALEKGKIKTIFTSLFVSIGIVLAIYNYSVSNPDSAISLAIVDRLEFSDNNFKGNNRVTKDVEFAYDNVVNSNDIFWGTNDYDYVFKDGGNNGYKVIIIRFGLIPLVLINLSFLCLGVLYTKKIVWMYLFILLIQISQNFYPYWSSTIILLFLGSNFLVHSRLNKY